MTVQAKARHLVNLAEIRGCTLASVMSDEGFVDQEVADEAQLIVERENLKLGPDPVLAFYEKDLFEDQFMDLMIDGYGGLDALRKALIAIREFGIKDMPKARMLAADHLADLIEQNIERCVSS